MLSFSLDAERIDVEEADECVVALESFKACLEIRNCFAQAHAKACRAAGFARLADALLCLRRTGTASLPEILKDICLEYTRAFFPRSCSSPDLSSGKCPFVHALSPHEAYAILKYPSFAQLLSESAFKN